MRKTLAAALALALAVPAGASSSRGGAPLKPIKALEPINSNLSPQSLVLLNALTAIAPLSPTAFQKQNAQEHMLQPMSIEAPAPTAPPASELAPGLEIAPDPQSGRPTLKISWDGAKPDLHPFDTLVPPNLGALDTREVRAKNAAPSAMPGFFGKWATTRRVSAIKNERMTTEEHSMRDTIVNVHALIKAGDPQTALDELTASFDNLHARDWYAQNPDFKPYWETAMGYYRAVEAGLKKDLVSAKRRGQDPFMAAEAMSHGVWKSTKIQEKDSGHCAFHAWYNALAATVGFADKLGVSEMIAKARAAINGRQKAVLVNLQLARSLGIREKARDIGDGMDESGTKEFSEWLGVPYEKMKMPANETAMLALMRSGRPILGVLRLFHDGHRFDPQVAKIVGHDHPAGHHAVYILGSYHSPRLGRRLFVVQDSGSGSTDLYTFEELRHLTRELEVLSPRGPVSVPN